ncbi:hypothetical protein [Streptomyces sp. NPDC102360]|uniref:hypothetical protein n=1 Tax=Streptomyces sp. NPDC102360 TaxID=3366160 RepID=UPI00381D68D6
MTHPSLAEYGGIGDTLTGAAILPISTGLYGYRRLMRDRHPTAWHIVTPDMSAPRGHVPIRTK